jgi:hypothetical protein
MAEKKTKAPVKEPAVKAGEAAMFTRENYIWMIAGLVVMAIGVLLMAGGKSEDPNVFNEDEVYSTTRITIAPIIIILGLVIEVFAIFRNPKA